MRNQWVQKIIILLFLCCVIAVSLGYWLKSTPPSNALIQMKEAEEIKNIQFFGIYKRISSIAIPASLMIIGAIIGGILAWAQVRKYSVHVMEIGDSKIPIHNKEVKRGMNPSISALIAARQLEQSNAGMEKAFQLYEAMTIAESRRLTALSRCMTSRFLFPSQQGSPYGEVGRELAPHIPTMQELLNNGELGQNKPMILGYTEQGQPDYSSWESLYSIIEGGQSGSGKTTSIRHIIASSLLSGQVGTFDIIDLAYPREQSLLQSIGNLREHSRIRWFDNTQAYGNLKTALERHLKYIYELFQRRATTPIDEKPPYVLVIDEIFNVGRICPKTYKLLHKINTEGRKDNIFELTSSHCWKGEISGGTEIRDCAETRIVHRMEPKQARMLLQGYPKEDINHVHHLRVGQAMVVPRGRQPQVITIPYNTTPDMNRVAEMLDGNAVKLIEKHETPEYIQIRDSLLSKFQYQKDIAQAACVDGVAVSRYFKHGTGKDEDIQKIKELV